MKHESEPGSVLWGFPNYPAVNVSWYDAVAFCRWLSAKLRLVEPREVRLPTEWEWQRVAQAGTDKRPYPWPGEWNPMRANSIESGIGRTVAVGMYPLGAPLPCSVMDLLGNVWEWCTNEYADPRNAQIGGQEARVVRGGGWGVGADGARSAARLSGYPDNRDDFIGFRVLCSSPIE